MFERERCASCHTPPLYTNNKLTPAPGFTPPAGDLVQIRRAERVRRHRPGSRDEDPTRHGLLQSAVAQRRLVSRAFEHSGSVATLEDWFDPNRLRDDYVPTGFKGFGVKSRAVKGHEFGLQIAGGREGGR